MKKNTVLTLIALAAGAGLLYWLSTRRKTLQVKTFGPALPPGTTDTGKRQVTYNNRPPNYPQESIGYGVRNWAEIASPDGRTSWVEIPMPNGAA